MKLPVSIIIPTLNEEKYLPRLLESIEKQTMQPSEIIVADAFSTDKTREIAKNLKCKIVDGGMPGKARNNGARVAHEDLLLFLDSDVTLPPSFLEDTISEMKRRDIDVASCFAVPLSPSPFDRYLHIVIGRYIKLVNTFYPHAGGYCIFVKKQVHEKIGGFDESVVLAEDHNYVKRAGKIGRFAYLESSKVSVSVRRIVKEGRLKLALKYIWVEFYRLFGGEVRKDHFRYQFGKFN